MNDGFNELCNAIKDVLGYDSCQMLTKWQILRLKGIARGQYMANNNKDETACYSYNEIKRTIELYRDAIDRAFSRNTFKDENHRFNYLCKIIENHINDVYLMMREEARAKQKAETIVKKSDNNARGTQGYKKIHDSNDKRVIEQLWGDI